MVRAMIATMLKVATGSLTLARLNEIIENRDSRHADFSAPAHGLFLVKVNYEDGILKPL